ncbi:EF-hand domain-containing protein [Crocosphaera sp. Alani8]|uniref:EF-hand domain-containing protein n=1 Tax=Crocosphaera sp. Alani8 TaxID=3038952 RepID=UPI00313D85AE
MSRNIGIKNLTQLLAFSILTTSLISCGQPSNNNQSTTSDTSEVVEFIPVETFAEIDVNQAGKVTAAEFIDYYVVKAKEGEKKTEEEAKRKFTKLDKDGNGELTKEEATGKK